MHKTTPLTTSLLAAALLLAGCGEKKDAGPAEASEAPASGQAKGSSSGKKGVPHQVVFEVGGTGTAQVMWNGTATTSNR